ncbi:hypothetical protein BDK92_6306 [Micromonospora pisi]|uniref:Excreted virulence factor EspC (Type VII ESX diderm) n=1 Tax=Micromonospora pisi TaxID=589240 RepID=A0A495JTK8_9ACTN|nr:hypothetical protein [Micromonospora pisi]RKR91878.1 hypothetical protein BDK92_6306 [Micromonospora pisi]
MNFVHMETTATAGAMDGIETAGREFGNAWSTLKGRIAADEAGIGSGQLAQAFLPRYQPDPVNSTADELSDAFLGRASVGRQCVEDYLAADRFGASGFGTATDLATRGPGG